MNDAAKIALEGSIIKWEGIVAGTRKDHGADDCPLCLLYMRSTTPSNLECVGCPVRAHTGNRHCRQTPYMEYTDNPSKENAVAELEFLRSLRDPDIKE